ncbi:MAG TPA: tripartite tricarboxylate transporter TctB family protein, partial [Beijerinckiaceae bacterium]|nr:tripartite tricarboxylate transporter TctB family protein [Beijerinckiaceae bacterium]
WLLSDLPQGTLRAMGPAMLPRWLAIGVGLCGLALVVFGIIRDGDPLEKWTFRGPIFVAIGIVAFAFTIRLFGLVVAGPLALIIGGFASDETRPTELVIFAAIMTAFCIGLFRYMLNQPMPILIIPGTSIHI